MENIVYVAISKLCATSPHRNEIQNGVSYLDRSHALVLESRLANAALTPALCTMLGQ